MFYDIKPLILWNMINYTYTIFLVLIWIVVYVLIFFRNKNSVIIERQDIDTNKINIENLIKELENNLEIKKDIFYKQFNYLLKIIIQQKFNKDITTLTYNEIEKLKIDEMLKDFLKATYFKEYKKNIEDSNDIRKNYIVKIKNLI